MHSIFLNIYNLEIKCSDDMKQIIFNRMVYEEGILDVDINRIGR